MVRTLSSVLSATVSLFGAVVPAHAALVLCSVDITAGRNLYGSAALACACKTSSCSATGDYCFTCTFLDSQTLQTHFYGMPYCATALPAPMALTRTGLALHGCASASAVPLKQSLLRQK